MNALEPGAGGLPSASPSDAAANPLEMKPKPRPVSGMMKHFNSREDTAAAQFKTIKESKSQIDSVMTEFQKLTELQDTVTSKDVVKGCAGIVAAGVPAIQMASILADMPEQGQELQAWVKKEFDLAVQADQKVVQTMEYLRHQMISAGFQTLIAHSAEAKMMSQPPQGRA